MSERNKFKVKNKNQQGVSLIELLLVVTILGIISAISIPYLVKAVGASENGSAFASLKVVSSTQVAFFTRNNRFGRLDEINAESDGGLGTMDGTILRRGVFALTMSPATPTNAQLRDDYLIIATKGPTLSNTPCVMTLTSSGNITEIFGTNCIDSQ